MKIRPFKGLQNGTKNPIEFLKEFSWAYKQKHKVNKPNNQKKEGVIFQKHIKYFSEATLKIILSNGIVNSQLLPKKTRIY